jgi:hypothetical protein
MKKKNIDDPRLYVYLIYSYLIFYTNILSITINFYLAVMDNLKYIKYKKRQNYNYIVDKLIKQFMEERGETQPAKRRKSNKQDDSRDNYQDDSRYKDDSNENSVYSQKAVFVNIRHVYLSFYIYNVKKNFYQGTMSLPENNYPYSP